jgi:uncharacterized membrane protein YhdT
MVRFVLLFLIVWGMVAFGIMQVRQMTGKELWSAVKLLTFSLFCAIITAVILSLIVFLF